MMIEKSWTELQALATRAATGAGVPASQSLAFGAMVPRHLSDDGSDEPLGLALKSPKTIVSLAQVVETLIESASLSPRILKVRNSDTTQRALLVSWLAGLPCQADVVADGEGVQARLSLGSPNTRQRPDRVSISCDLLRQMETLAARTYVPDSAESRASGAGAGASAMVLAKSGVAMES